MFLQLAKYCNVHSRAQRTVEQSLSESSTRAIEKCLGTRKRVGDRTHRTQHAVGNAVASPHWLPQLRVRTLCTMQTLPRNAKPIANYHARIEQFYGFSSLYYISCSGSFSLVLIDAAGATTTNRLRRTHLWKILKWEIANKQFTDERRGSVALHWVRNNFIVQYKSFRKI